MSRPVVRPPAIWVLVVNAAGYSWPAGRSRGVIRSALRVLVAKTRLAVRGELRLGDLRQPDLIAVSEATGVRIADMVDLRKWQVVQFGELGDSESGCALLARRSRVLLTNPRIVAGSPAVQGNDGRWIDPRWIVIADAEVSHRGRWVQFGPVGAVHEPPGRAAPGQEAYEATLDRLDDVAVFAGDFNRDAPYLRKRLQRRVRAVAVLAVAMKWRIHAGRPRRRNVKSDHPGVLVRLYLKENR